MSAAGVAQANAVALALEPGRYSAIYSSDLERVRETAAPAAARLARPARPVELDAGLRERHYGSFQTLTYREAERRFPHLYARFRARDLEFDFEGGESLRAFAARVEDCIARIAARHAGEEVLVFTHGGVLDIVHRRAKGMKLQTRRDFDLPNAALNRVEIAGTQWRVLAWGERAHLPTSLDELPL